MKDAMTSTTPSPIAKIRHAGGLLFLAGEMPFDAQGEIPEGIEAQTALTLDRIAATLAGQGLDLTDVVSVTVHLADLGDFAAFNRVYGARLSAPYPVRTTVRADLVRAAARVELTVVACARQ